MIARTKMYDPMAPFLERPQMLPRATLAFGQIRVPYVNADGKQICLLFESEADLNYLERSIIDVRLKLSQQRIDEMNDDLDREISAP
jgi:hypothetical protein